MLKLEILLIIFEICSLVIFFCEKYLYNEKRMKPLENNPKVIFEAFIIFENLINKSFIQLLILTQIKFI